LKTAPCDVVPCSLVEVDRRFTGAKLHGAICQKVKSSSKVGFDLLVKYRLLWARFHKGPGTF
jgi:hypothetical protein